MVQLLRPHDVRQTAAEGVKGGGAGSTSAPTVMVGAGRPSAFGFLTAGPGRDRPHADPLTGPTLMICGLGSRIRGTRGRSDARSFDWLADQGIYLPALDEVQSERFRRLQSRLRVVARA